jgi:hypothetical protein
VWRSFLLWLPACVALGVCIASAAVVAEEKFAPLIIFPLLVGVGLGAMAVGLMRLAQVGNRPTLLCGAVLAAAATVVGQHYLRYQAERKRVERQVEEFRSTALARSHLLEAYQPSPPANLVAYLQAQARTGRDMKIHGYVARGWAAWLSWAMDGLLVLAAAVAMVAPAMRLPFCNGCGSWYRVTRSGRIDARTAGRLAELADVCLEELPTSARYRLLNCSGGCGPTDFQLSWQQPRGAAFSAQAWLDAACRDRVRAVLDEAKVENSKHSAVGSGQ